MRIIGGLHKGRLIKTPGGLPVRPTTDFAKEGLFNILANKIDFSGLSVLDLFSGTGHISLEFASRGSREVISVDKHFKCVGFQKAISRELGLNIEVLKSDVFDFLKHSSLRFDLIFADPPYDLQGIPDIHKWVFERQLLNDGGLLIIEHGAGTVLSDLPGFIQHRRYGNVNFSFFRAEEKEVS
jgi:16S rRNA (guanine966-N2)-methyltransferase